MPEVLMDAFNDMLRGELGKMYITPAEGAKMTGLSASTIRRAAQNGEIRAMRAGQGRGGAIHIRLDSFMAWLHTREEQASGRPTD